VNDQETEKSALCSKSGSKEEWKERALFESIFSEIFRIRETSGLFNILEFEYNKELLKLCALDLMKGYNVYP
jgi:hypothetical protein